MADVISPQQTEGLLPEELAKLQAIEAGKPDVTPAAGQAMFGGSQSTDGGLTSDEMTAMQESLKTGKPVNVHVEWNDYLKNPIKDVAKHYSAGDHSITKGVAWAKYIYGETSIEDARKETAKYAVEDQQTAQGYANIPYSDARKYLYPIAETAPFFKEVYEDTAQGGLAGAGVGAGAGFFTSGPAGAGVLGGAGAILGGEAAGATGAGRIAAGNMMSDLDAAGVPEHIAKPMAVGAGAFVGALQVVHLGFLGNMATKAAGSIESTMARNMLGGFGKEAGPSIGNYVKQYLKGATLVTVVGDLQAATEILTKQIADMATGSKSAPSYDQIKDIMLQATLAGPMMAGFGMVGAKTMGAGAKAFNEHLFNPKQSKTPLTDAAKVLGAVIKEAQDSKKLMGSVEKEVHKKTSTKTESEREIEATHKTIADTKQKIEQQKARIEAAHSLAENQTPARKELKKLQLKLQLEESRLTELKAADLKQARFELAASVEKISKRDPNRKKASAYGPEHGDLLREYEKLIENQHDQRKKKNVPQNEAVKILQDDSTVGTVKRRIASQVVGLDEQTPQQIRKLNETIKSLLEGGTDERISRDIAKLERRKAIADALKAAIPGDEKLTQDQLESRIKSKKPFWTLDTLMQPQKTWNALMDQICIRSKNGTPDGVQIHDQIYNEMAAIEDRITQAIEKIAGGSDKESLDRLQDLAERSSEQKTVTDSNGQPLTYVDVDGNVRQKTASIGNLMQWYMDLKRPSMENGLVNGNKFTFKDNAKNNSTRPLVYGETSFEEFIDTSLTDYQKGVADRMMEHYNDDAPDSMFNTLNAAHIDEFALPLEKDENYTGNRKHLVNNSIDGSLEDRQQMFKARQKPIPGAAHEKVNSALAYREDNAFRRFYTDIATNTSWEMTKDIANDMYKVFGDQDVINSVTAYGNQDTIKIVNTAIEDSFGAHPQMYANKIKVFDKLTGNVAGVLGGKPESALKQTSSFLIFLGDPNMTVKQFSIGISKAVMNPKEVTRVFKDSRFLRFREQLTSKEYQDWLNSDGPKWMRKNPKLIKASMWFLVKGDRITARAGGYPVYLAAYDRAILQKKTPEQAHEYAIKYFDKFANETQGSGSKDQRTHLERAGNSIQTMATQLGKQPIQIAGQELNAINKAKHNPTKDNIAYAARVIFAAHAAEALFQGLGRIPQFASQDKKERDRAAMMTTVAGITGPFGSVPLTGDLLLGLAVNSGNVFGKALDKDFKTVQTFESRNPYDSAKHNGVELSNRVAKLAEGKEMDHDAFWGILKNIGGLSRFVTPLPVPAVVKHAEAVAPKQDKKRRGLIQQ